MHIDFVFCNFDEFIYWFYLSVETRVFYTWNNVMCKQWQLYFPFQFVHVKSLQSCLTLCSPMDCSPPGFSVLGILPVRILKWVAMPPSQPRDGSISLTFLALASRFFTISTTWRALSLNLDDFYFLSYMKAVARLFNTMLNRSGG